uniref:Uncharacterized protein n=1 Tax=Aegilops tauschii subsp. strangulata TaxID=200361 RepID=A0A453DKN3_AEGTS
RRGVRRAQAGGGGRARRRLGARGAGPHEVPRRRGAPLRVGQRHRQGRRPIHLAHARDWDESVVGSLRNRHVNAWQVELVGYPPILKKLKISETILPPMCSGDVSVADPLLGPDCENMVMLLGSPIPAGMQGARHIGLTELPSPSPTVLTTKQFFPPSSSGGSSEVVNPEAGSPPNNSVNMRPSEERRSIQLFGATITSPVQSATNGSSEEVSQAPDAAVDGTAHEDACATSLLD